MLAYAANRPVAAARRPSPNVMLAIIVGHVAIVAAVMSAKMDLPQLIRDGPIHVILVPNPPPPPPTDDHMPVRTQPGPTVVSHPNPIPLPSPDPVFFPDRPVTADPGPLVGTDPVPIPNPIPRPVGTTSGPQLATPASELKPPYPSAKLMTEEEAVLKLRLTIDDQGRVVAVESVGRADPVFLQAARRHLLAHWRYKPAMEDGRAVTSSTVVTLHFRLDA